VSLEGNIVDRSLANDTTNINMLNNNADNSP